MILLDTDVMVDLLRQYPPAVTWLDSLGEEEIILPFVWFGAIEHPLVMRFILALGADGLMVNDPVALAKVLGR